MKLNITHQIVWRFMNIELCLSCLLVSAYPFINHIAKWYNEVKGGEKKTEENSKEKNTKQNKNHK